jgi:M6 family metalloprotease-like protein
VFLALLAYPAHALMPPARGNTRGLPANVREALRRDPSLLYPRKGFKDVIARQRLARAGERSRLMRAGMSEGMADKKAAQSTAVTRFCPVLCGIYADKGTPDWPASDLNDELFSLTYSQNNPFGDPGSMREKYRDMSYGTFDLQGGVFGWFPVPQPGAFYYSDDNGLGLDRTTGETGAFIRHTLQAADGTIDFRPYDNDGPDGVPNSGDDDGYVDLVMFVHPNEGGECGGSDIWSHSFHYSGWPENGQPFVTDDLGANGQPLKVDDYVIMPAVACGGARRIETGVFAHEFGHALGLPDLYDRTAVDAQGLGLVSSGGMGLYCLMAAGSYGGDYDHPAYSVNMCAWSKEQLGWITPREVTCDEPATLYFQGDAPEALKLWRGGDYSGKEHFLVENRQQKKWDQYLLGNGFLITHVDDGVLTQNDEPCPGGNPCLSGHYQVGVVEADNQWEMQTAAAPLMGPWFGESEDFFSAAGNDSLTDLTGPSSRAHDGSFTGVRVTGISASGEKMTANVSVGLACTPLPALSVDRFAVQGGCDLDGYPDPGEVVDLAVTLRNLPSGAPASHVHGTLTSLTPAYLTVITPGATFPNLDRGHYGESIVPFRVGVPAGAPCGAQARLRLDLTADGGYAASRELLLRVRVDSTFVPLDPFMDDVESGSDNGWHHYAYVYEDDWSRSTNGNHTVGALPGTSWFASAPPTGKDVSLEPPAFIPSSSSVLSYWHRYDTEDNWDGYVLELTTDGGTTWQDVGDLTNTGYDDTVMVNPQSTISGRRCWNGLNDGFPQFEQVTLGLAAWAGQTVRVRFRLATDLASTGVTPFAGVNIDDLSLTGAQVLREACEQLASCANADHDPPVFAGLVEALNPGLPSCDALDLKWAAATDASGPIRYLVYASPTLPVPLGEPIASTQALRIRIPGLAYGTWNFVVRARDSQGNVDGNSVVRSIDLACDPPVLAIQSFALSELQGCDGDGRPDAGEYLNLGVVLENQGSSDAWNVRAHLRSLSPYVAIRTDEVGFPDLARAHHEAAAQPFQIQVSNDAPCMTAASLELEILADGGHRELRTLELVLESDLAGTQVVCDATAACNTVSVGADVPGVTVLGAPRPSPTRGPASLSYAIAPAEAGRVSLRVYDVAGRMVRTLFDGERRTGRYDAHWDGADASGAPARGGIYFARLETAGRRLTQRIVTLR